MTYFTQIPLMFELVLGANLVVDSTGRGEGGRGGGGGGGVGGEGGAGGTQDVENDHLVEFSE